MKTSDKITKLRKRMGYSQEDLANELGVSRQAVFKWESGENMPDIDKIKKLAKLFNVTFDDLLDDDKEIDNNIIKEKPIEKETIIVEKHYEKPVERKVIFRKAYDSEIRLITIEEADFQHGYIEGITKIKKETFEENLKCHNELIEKKKYSKTIRVQQDLLIDFYIDDHYKVFGFFFDGAPQFICPFENLTGFSITNSGPQQGYRKTRIFGLGLGRQTSVGVGSMPMSNISQPNRYDLVISYLDENKYIKDYKIAFGTPRIYWTKDNTIKNMNEYDLLKNALSLQANKSLNEISSYLNGIKDIGNQIRNGNIPVIPVNFSETFKKEVETGQRKKEITRNGYLLDIEEAKKRRTITFLIVLFCIILFFIVFVSINTILEKVE